MLEPREFPKGLNVPCFMSQQNALQVISYVQSEGNLGDFVEISEKTSEMCQSVRLKQN